MPDAFAIPATVRASLAWQIGDLRRAGIPLHFSDPRWPGRLRGGAGVVAELGQRRGVGGAWRRAAGAGRARAPPRWDVPGRLAAAVVGDDRAGAGQRLLARGDPATWNAIVEGYTLREAGGKALTDCLARAEKRKKAVACTVTISPKAE